MVEPPDTETINAWVARAPTNLEQLLEHLAELFHAWLGPARAYVELPLQPVEVAFTDAGNEVKSDRGFRFYFEFLGVEAIGKREDVEADLVKRFMVPFLAARILGLDLLIWRMVPRIESHRNEEGKNVVRLVCRVFIPGFDLTEYRAPWLSTNPLRRFPSPNGYYGTASSPATDPTQTKS